MQKGIAYAQKINIPEKKKKNELYMPKNKKKSSCGMQS
jgi:hypothetical protein